MSFSRRFCGAGNNRSANCAGGGLGFALAFISGLGSLSKSSIIRFVTGVYVEIFRGTSLLVQLFWMFYALPLFGIRLPGMVVGVLALGMNFGAYGSEVMRSSIIAVPGGR